MLEARKKELKTGSKNMSKKNSISILNFDISDNSMGRVYILARALSKDFTVEIVGPSRRGGIWPPVKDTDVTIKEIPYVRIPALFFNLSKMINKIDSDIIYAVKPRFTSFGLGLFKKWLQKKPLILDIDDWELGFYLRKPFLSRAIQMIHVTNPNGYFWTWLLHKFISQADAITTVSTFLQKKYGGIIIPHAKDTDLLNPDKYNPVEIKKELGWDKYKIVMFLGTPREHKGVEDALRAVCNINNPALKMAIVGANPDGKYERKLMSIGKEKLILTDRIKMNDVPRYLSVADIVVIPQRETPDTVGQIPSKLFDAMAMAKPIITTRVSDIPDIVKDGAIVVSPGNIDEISEAIEYILSHPEEVFKMGLEARKMCIKHYSIGAIREKLYKLFYEVLDENK